MKARHLLNELIPGGLPSVERLTFNYNGVRMMGRGGDDERFIRDAINHQPESDAAAQGIALLNALVRNNTTDAKFIISTLNGFAQKNPQSELGDTARLALLYLKRAVHNPDLATCFSGVFEPTLRLSLRVEARIEMHGVDLDGSDLY